MARRPLFPPRRALAALAAAALAGIAATGAARQVLLPEQSQVAYAASQMGVQVEGNFGRFEAQVDLDPKRLPTSSVSFSVDTGSVVFPSPDVQQELAKPDWFDTAHFPKAEFRSKRIGALGGSRYEIAGTLTIKGHVHEVVFPVTLTQSGATTFASGALTIRRLDYGIGEGEWRDTSLIEDDVKITFKIALAGMTSG